MTIKTFLVGIAIVTGLCFLAWLAVIMYIDPELAGWVGLILFYFSLFLWLCGFLILFGFYLRHLFSPKMIPYTVLSVSVRQAIILSLAANIFLILKGIKMLNNINGLFLLISVIFIESYFLSLEHEHLRRNR